MITTHPAERLFLDVGLLIVRQRPVEGLFPQEHSIVMILPLFERDRAPVLEIPRWLAGSRIILDMFYFAAPLQHQRLQPLIAKFFGRPPAAGAGSDDDRIVRPFFRRIRRIIWHGFML